MVDQETARREDGKPRRPRRVITKDHQQDGGYQYHQSADGESQSGSYHANNGNNGYRGNGNRGGYNRDNRDNRDGNRSYNRDNGGYNRDNRDGNRDNGGYNRDNRDGNRNNGGYNRDNRDGNRGYNRDGNHGGYNRGSNYNRDSRDGNRDNSGYNRDNRDNRDNGSYNRDNQDGNRDNGSYNRDNHDGSNSYHRGGYNRDNHGNNSRGDNGGYNRDNNGRGDKRYTKGDKGRKPMQQRPKKEVIIPETARPNPANEGLTRLNKYLGNAGVCSRREADKLIAAGAVKVNGEVVTSMGFMVKPSDVVTYGGETLQKEKKRYLLLNKPKGYITTTDDPEGRHTVMELIQDAYKERLYPVGRLDRNTTGLLLFTNDGDMSKKLMHPSTGIYKIYHVELDKPLTAGDMNQIREGIVLEDGPIKADDIQYVGDGVDQHIVGVAIHSGRNRIVRRIFASLGYDVVKLDRVVFAGLTKKDLPRGRYRDLTEKEVAFLQMI